MSDEEIANGKKVMRVGYALLPGGLNWRIRPSDPSTCPIGDGWEVVNPLVPLYPTAPDVSALPMGDEIFIGNLNALHMCVPDGVDHGRLGTRVEAALAHLRVITLDPRSATTVGATAIQERSDLPAPEKPSFPKGIKVRFFSNRDRTAASLEDVAEAFRRTDGPPPPVAATLVLDAIKAMSGDPRQALLLGAIAVEVLASTVIDEAYHAALDARPGRSDLRIIERGSSGGVIVRKDPIYDLLRTSARRSFALLLHELPLYVLQRSLLQDDEDLYRAVLRLHGTRNLLAHQGEVSDPIEAFPVSHEGAREGLGAVRLVFEWFGAPDYFIGQ